MEVADSKIATDCKVLWRNHPIIASNYKEITYPVHGDLTVRQVLINSGIDAKQPILIVLDDKLLTVEEWDEVCPKVGQIINVHASVLGGGGGGGGSNPIQTVAMIALVVAVTYFTMGAATGFLGAYTAAGLGFSAFQAAIIGGTVLMAGSMVINSVFAASNNATSLSGVSGTYAEASPTYSLSGGSNRIRPYESMPVVFGTHQLFPDLGSRPYTEYQGEDQYLYQIFNFGLSSLELSDFKIGTTDITDYSDYEWVYPDSNGKISRFPGNVDAISGANLTASSGWITRTTSNDTYRIGIDIEGMLYYANNSGGMDSTSVQIRVQYKPTSSDIWIDPSSITTQGGGFATGHYETYEQLVESVDPEGVDTSHFETRTKFVTGSGGTVIVSGASQTARRATLFIDVPVGEYDVRMIRDTADSTDSRLQNKTSWSALRSYQLDNASYIGQSRRGLIIRASSQLNGAISRLSCTATARARYYDGSSWQFAATSNPAHWFTDFSLGRYSSDGKLLYGAGKQASELALDDLVDWANFCSQEGLTFDAVLDGNQTVEDYLNTIAKCGFASVSRASGKLGVIWDKRNSPPVAAFGMSNILNGSFNVSYINENLAEEIVCKYINPENDWNQDEVRKTVPGVTDPLRTSTIDLYGCKNKAMAGKFANYFAAQQYYRKRRISWDCDFEGFVCQRGDVVLLSHDLTQWGYSGRIVSKDGNTLKLDKKVPRTQDSDHIMIRRPDGAMSTYSVLGGDGESDELALTTTPEFQADYLDIDHIWFFSPLQTPGKLVKILSVKPTSDSRASIIATDENPEFYSAWDGDFNSPSISTLLINNSPIASNISATESLYRKTAGIISKVTVSFSIKGAFDHANYRYRVNDGQWISGVSNVTNFNFDANEAGMVDVEITPVGQLVSGSTVTKRFEIFGLLMPPSDVTGMRVINSGKNATLEFDPCQDLDWAYTEIRVGETWNNSDLIAQVKSSSITLPFKTERWSLSSYSISNQIFARHVDSSRVYSKNISSITNLVERPNKPLEFSVSISGSDLVATAKKPNLTSFDFSYFRLYDDKNSLIAEFSSDSFKFKPSDEYAIAGTHNFFISSVDIAGNESERADAFIVISIPNQTRVTPTVIDNTVLLRWADSKTSFPIDRYEVSRGEQYSSAADVVTGSNARFATFIEVFSWTYVYWVTAVDVHNNRAEPAKCFAAVRQPDDYVLQANYLLNGSGAGSGFACLNDSIFLPVVDESFDEHYLNNNSATPQELIDAGFDIYSLPTGTLATYSEIIDFKSIIGIAMVNFNHKEDKVIGDATLSIQLYSRASDGDEWVVLQNQYQGEAYNFRYVKVEITAISDNSLSLSKISNAEVSVITRKQTDFGKGSALASDQNGTVVYFSKQFSDCQTPIVQANSDQPLIPVVNFLDSPNPTSFSVFFYDIAGSRVTTDFSWTVTGV